MAERQTASRKYDVPEVDDPFARIVLRIAYNVRHYMALYALGLVLALVIALFPSANEREGDEFAPGQVGTIAGGGGAAGGFDGTAADGGFVDGAAGSSGAGATGGGAAAGGAGSAAGRSPGAAGAGGAQAGGAAGGQGPPGITAQSGGITGTGVTRGGFECKPNVRQLPFSDYAPPCVSKFTGENPGATWNGVTKDTIKFADRYNPEASSDATARGLNEGLGLVDPETGLQIRNKLVEYFNKTFELYGRKVVVERVAQSGTDQEASCADAAKIAEQVKAFGVLSSGEPFSTCATQRKLFQPAGMVYYAEPWYQKAHPYVWHTLPACDLPAVDFADYVGKRLGKKQAKWAGDPTFVTQERVYGLWIPNDPWYAYCGDLFEKRLKDTYGITIKSRYNYLLDLNTAQQQTQQAVVQFKAAGVTTWLGMCEGISPIFLTQQATQQNWRPEWVTAGYAFSDVEAFARLWDQSQVDGHYWGMSQLSGPRVTDPNGEAHVACKNAGCPETDKVWEQIYFSVIHLFNTLQVAGPNLTPANIAAGMKTLPVLGAKNPAWGTWDFTDGSHTGIKDSREIFWEGKKRAPDGKVGVFTETYGGRRFRGAQWTKEDPPIYPGP